MLMVLMFSHSLISLKKTPCGHINRLKQKCISMGENGQSTRTNHPVSTCNQLIPGIYSRYDVYARKKRRKGKPKNTHEAWNTKQNSKERIEKEKKNMKQTCAQGPDRVPTRQGLLFAGINTSSPTYDIYVQLMDQLKDDTRIPDGRQDSARVCSRRASSKQKQKKRPALCPTGGSRSTQ